MNAFKIIGIILMCFLCFSCEENELTQEDEVKVLNKLFSEIEDMASGVSCTDASEWSFTEYGSKACGGPVGFIAYSTSINTNDFIEKVQKYKIRQKEFNEKWNVLSDCSIPAVPLRVVCENGQPVFEY